MQDWRGVENAANTDSAVKDQQADMQILMQVSGYVRSQEGSFQLFGGYLRALPFVWRPGMPVPCISTEKRPSVCFYNLATTSSH